MLHTNPSLLGVEIYEYRPAVGHVFKGWAAGLRGKLMHRGDVKRNQQDEVCIVFLTHSLPTYYNRLPSDHGSLLPEILPLSEVCTSLFSPTNRVFLPRNPCWSLGI